MKVPELFKFVKASRTYYFYTGSRNCNFCNKEIIDPLGLLHFFWHKNHSSILLLHPKCNNKLYKIKPLSIIHEQYSVLFCYELPGAAIPIFISPPTLKDGIVKDVFSAANLVTDKTIDKTKYSGRGVSLEGATIGLITDKKALMLDSEIENKEI